MTANPEPESSSIFCRPPKPPLAEKPVPKPRRRLTIGGHDAGKMEEIWRPKEPKLEEEAGKGRAAPPPPLARKAMAYRNGTAALLVPQLARKVQKMGENGQQDLMVKSGIEAAAKRPKGEQRGETRLRRSNTTLTASSRPNKMIFESNGPTRAPTPCQRLRIPAPPPPPPVKRIQQRKMENDGQNGKRHWGEKGEKAKAPIAAPHLPQKEHSPIPYLTPFCPTASPEASSSLSPSSAATTGSSLNSPSPPSPPPPMPHIFAQSWPSGGAKGDADKMLEELAKEGGAECRLIASWLSGDGAAENAGQNEEGEKEEERPRFSLDRLIPPELQESPQSSSTASIWADFSLRRPSPRGQCQGTVFVHWHQEKGRLDFSMENGKKSVPPPNFVPNRLSQHSPSPRRQGVTPLEQLVKSHPIWFLPHLDRQAVGHLLRNQPAGVFIVRASSRSIRQSPPQPNTSPNHLNPLKKSRSGAAGPVMALSIRLPISAQNDQEDDHLEHFLLEAVGPGQSVRLEGSPNIFASLPLLLEHYTQPEALQELKCRLRLPEAIARSESIHALQGMALMGQDFWTSSLSTAPASAANSPEALSSSSAHSPTSASLRSGPLPPPAPPMSTFLLPQFPHRPLQSAYCQSPSPSMATTLDGATASEDGFESAYGHRHQMMAQMPNGGNGCCCCCAGCPAHQMAPKMQQQHLYQYQQFPPLRKSHSVQSSFPPQHQPNGQSAGRHPWCQSPGSQSLREGRKLPPPAKQKDGFLRSLFSPSPSRRKQSSSSDWTGAENPLWEEQAEGQIWNGQKRKGQNGNNGQQQSIFARLKGKNNPFRRTNSSALGAKDDWQAATNSNMSPEMLWARQAAFRRTNTDMGGCGMAAALGRMRGAAPNPPNGPLPQLARVLPQPRREMNGPALQAQIAAAPADIRKNSFQKSRWVQSFQQQSSPQHFEAAGLKRIPQRGMADSAGGGQQNGAAFRLSKGSQTRSQAMIATVRPQQKMSILTKENREEPEKLAEDHRPSEYTHLNELKSDGEWEGGRGSLGSKSGDELSVAGTDFNEPWDSNAWENLLDLARFGDTKAEVPLLADEQPKRRICSTSSNGSTWRRSSQSSSTEAEEEEPKGGKIEGASGDEMTAAAEEAMAMAMILAGNGTLPNSRKKPRTEQWSEGEENDPQLAETHQNPSLDTLILIEQAAKAANSSRGLQRGRWTRATSSSLIDMTKTTRNGRLALVPDRPELEEDGAVPGSSNDYDPFSACSMEHHHHHSHQNGVPIPTACSSSMDELSHHSRSGSICPSITPVLSPSRLRNASQDHPGEEDPARVIQRYVENLSINDQTVFGATLQRFIECTLLSREQDPYVVVRRVRQFLNGMKNYLIKNGESDLHAVVERQSDRLHADEFLNIDAILESVLNKILLVRIKAQLYRLMILESTRNGELGKLSENLATVRAMNSADLGFPEGTPMPDKTRMEQISKQMRKMQNHYSPLKKLQLLLRALALAVPHLPLLASSEMRHQQAQQSNSSILVVSQSFSGARLRSNSGSSSNGSAALKHPPADELIRWLVYLLARSSTINCEIEAWYMWELLPQQVLSTGDAAYFLSILFSAVHVIKHPESIRRLKNVTLPAANHPLPNIADFLGSQSTLHEQEDSSSDLLLRVAIPNEQEGSIEYHTFPVLPKMNASKLCRVIAHQFSVSNPEDYGLYLMFDGLETVLTPGEFPHLIRDHMIQSGKAHLFAYKRSEARIAWPKQAISNFTNSGNAPNIAPAHTPLQRNLIAPQIGGKEGR